MRITNEISTMDSIVLSVYILKHADPMTLWKLQKLLFYCDAYCLAYFDKELLGDKFEAWVHGPVSRKVYDYFVGRTDSRGRLYYDINFTADEDNEFEKLASTQKELISAVLKELSIWDTAELESAVCAGVPWKEARGELPDADKCCALISKETTRLFYKKDVNKL